MCLYPVWMAHDTASEAFSRSRFHVPNPSSGMVSRVNGCGVKMVSGSSGICAVGGLAGAAATHAASDTIERKSFILIRHKLSNGESKINHRSSTCKYVKYLHDP